MKILVIGGNGFIGSHLVESLCKTHEVSVLDRSTNKFTDGFQGVEYIYEDFQNGEKLKEVLQGKDIVFHLLSTTVPITANRNPHYDIESNLIGTLNLLELISNSDVKRFIYVSSGGTVYGNPQYLPIDEKHPCNPIGSYGIIKKTIEDYVRMYSQKGHFSYLIVRPSNPFGPRQNFLGDQGIIAKLLYQGIAGDEFTVWGDGSAVRDYIFIDDLISFLKKAGLSEISGVYNVGSGKGRSINDIIEMLKKVTNQLPSIKYAPKNGFFVEKVVLDVTSSRNTFDWKPEYTMEEGLVIQHNWIKNVVNQMEQEKQTKPESHIK